MPSKQLMKKTKAYEDYRARQAEDEARLVDRLEGLEKASGEALEIVAADNADSDARARLEDADGEIAAVKKEIQAFRRRTRNRMRAMRTRLLQAQEDALASLEKEMKETQSEQAELQKVLMPEAESHLASLRERDARADEQLAAIQEEMAAVYHTKLDELFQE